MPAVKGFGEVCRHGTIGNMKCNFRVPKIRGVGRLFACWHIIAYHNTSDFIRTIYSSYVFLTTGFWPDPCWYYRNYMLFKLRTKGQEYDIKEIFDLNIYALDPSAPEPVIVDIGASIGDSLMFFAARYPRAKFYAFEPNTAAYRYITQNLEHADTSENEVHLYNRAVSHGGRTSADFYLASDVLTPSWSSTNRHILPKQHVKRSYKVPSISFSSLLSLTGNIDLLKIDIEGGEYELIPDIIRYSSRINSFVMEIHSFGERRHRQTLFRSMSRLSEKYALYIKPDYYHTVMHQGFDSTTEFPADEPSRFGFMLYGKLLK